MSLALAILGFVIAIQKNRSHAIIFCIFGLLTYILAFVVGSLQLVSYYKEINDVCYVTYY